MPLTADEIKTRIKWIKGRPSSLKELMMGSKTDPLGDAAKDVVFEMIQEQVFQRPSIESSNSYTSKGKMTESEGISMINKFTKSLLKKNTETRENKWFRGTLDTDDDKNNILYDVKSRYNIKTYLKGIINSVKEHKHQMNGYMDIWDRPVSYIANVLLNTPSLIILDEQRRGERAIEYSSEFAGLSEEDKEKIAIELREKIYNQHTFYEATDRWTGELRTIEICSIPFEFRIKLIEIERDNELIEQMHEQMENVWVFAENILLGSSIKPQVIEKYKKVDHDSIVNIIEQQSDKNTSYKKTIKEFNF